MRFALSFVVLALVASLAVAENVPFETCGTGHVTPKSIDVSPWPVTAGSNVVFTLLGSSDEQVTAGNYTLEAQYLGITILTKTGSICDLDPKYPCPFASGPITIDDTLAVPSIAPAGEYTIQVSATDQNGNALLCVSANVNIGSAARPMINAVQSRLGDSVPFTNCAGDTPATIKEIDVSPFPPAPGSPVDITVTGQLAETVTGGNYSLTVEYLGIPLYSKTGDLCTLDPSKFPCPQNPGPITITKDIDVPSIAPAGEYTIQVSATDQNGNTLLCVSINVNINADQTRKLRAAADASPAITQELVDHINGLGTSWQAGFNPRFADATVGQVRRLCGSRFDKSLPVKQIQKAASVPDTFDSRQAWPQCANIIGAIRDQGSCGSCWAVSAAETLSDRICIGSNATSTPYIASEDVLSCCGFFCGDGCDGGYPSGAWSYFQSTGCVTGGPYNSGQGCYPYQVPACEHHVSGPLPPCEAEVNTPTCTQTCLNGLTWANDKHFATSSYSVPADMVTIQTEIMTNGPVQATFTVYSDFVTYKSGVYQQTSQDALGGHAVKIIGWGTEGGLPYWLVANSWNEGWGNKGYFKILRGSDECGIEDGIVAGLANK